VATLFFLSGSGAVFTDSNKGPHMLPNSTASSPLDHRNLGTLRITELLRLYCEILQELLRREVCRSTNNPLADLSELLVINALSLIANPKSTKGYDAADAAGKRYEIKGRRLTAHNGSRMLSAIRDCHARHFDYLAGVLYQEDFSLHKACLVPFEIVLRESKYRKHTNAHIFELKDELWATSGVIDISKEIAAALSALDVKAAAASAR
jgi:hypothetical protein